MKAAELFIRCIENEGTEYVFGIPGEENVDVMDALVDSPLRFITTRHEQGAAFMADVYGRLTGRAGVCLSTLGPGATNLITGVADANMDRAPLVAIAGQGATTRLHKESHQILDLVNLFEPITKYATQLREPEIIPEVVRKAFKVAQAEKPGCAFVDFPENIAAMEVEGAPLKVQSPAMPHPPRQKIAQAASLIRDARFPIIMAGNGVIRAGASEQLVKFAEHLRIPIATTFMAKGVIPFSHPLALGAVGLGTKDYVNCGFDRADLILCVGYDMVEYHPSRWHAGKDKHIVHIDTEAAEVDEHYIVASGLVGSISAALTGLLEEMAPRPEPAISGLREVIVREMEEFAGDTGFPIKPQKILWDLRQVLGPRDVVISDVGAHKMWVARSYQAEAPNTCIISNGFASMGIAVPGALAARLADPTRRVVALTGDAGFLMNSQEMETALRVGTPFVILIWNDAKYGLIEWHQLKAFGRSSHIDFGNPDFVKYAESFGAKGYRVGGADELRPILEQALADDTVSVIDCPVDYRENMKLTQKLGELVCPT